jgi:hypothetical protein
MGLEINGEKIMRTIPKMILFVLTLGVISAACAAPVRPRVIQGSGDIIVEDRKVSGFKEIQMAGAGRMIITQGDEESLSIETDDNLLEYIETKVTGDTLEIDFTDEIILAPGGENILDPSEGFVFRISVIDLDAILVSGGADIQVGKLKTERFLISFSGAGNISVDDLSADNLEVIISGAGNVDLTGKVSSQEIRLSGLGHFGGFDLESQRASVTISGAGGADLWATEALDVVISGAGDVDFYGNPTLSQEISGLGRLQSLGEK